MEDNKVLVLKRLNKLLDKYSGTVISTSKAILIYVHISLQRCYFIKIDI